MEVQPDFRDPFAALNDAGVECPLVGAHALAPHGHVRAMKVAPVRIDLLTTIDDVTFDEAWANRARTAYAGEELLAKFFLTKCSEIKEAGFKSIMVEGKFEACQRLESMSTSTRLASKRCSPSMPSASALETAP